jgi:hypothetical protein
MNLDRGQGADLAWSTISFAQALSSRKLNSCRENAQLATSYWSVVVPAFRFFHSDTLAAFGAKMPFLSTVIRRYQQTTTNCGNILG